MNDHAKFTNGDWHLPRHARGVHSPMETTHVPAGEPGHIVGHRKTMVLVDPSNPEKGWALK